MDAVPTRTPFVHLDSDGVVLSTGHMPPSIPPEAIAASGRLVVTEAIYAQLQQPGRWSLKDGVPALLPPEEVDARRRALVQRARLLAASDWTQMPDVPDVPGNAAWRARWATYRQALRDLPTQPGFPSAIDWPQPPAAV